MTETPAPARRTTPSPRFARAAGASVVLVDGVPALYLERGGRTLQTLPAFDDSTVAAGFVSGYRGLVLRPR